MNVEGYSVSPRSIQVNFIHLDITLIWQSKHALTFALLCLSSCIAKAFVPLLLVNAFSISVAPSIMTARLLRSADLGSVKVACTSNTSSTLRKHPLHDISEEHNDLFTIVQTSMVCRVSDVENQSPSSPLKSDMPVAAGSGSLLSSLPTFMSVFGESENARDGRGIEVGALKPGTANTVNKRPPYYAHASSPLFRKDSVGTFESVESSPTTTISTMDTTLTEPSPSSSPESPNSIAPRSKSITAIPNGLSGMEQPRPSTAAFPAFGTLNRGDSPNKRMRNMKNLSVNTSTSRPSPSLPQIAMSNNQAITNSHAFSAPPTPSFVVPTKQPRKRPSTLGLSILTPDSNGTNSSPAERTNVVPHTPLITQPRTLSYLQTASNAPLIGSPKLAPEGGMKLPPFPVQTGQLRNSKPRPSIGHSNQASFDSSHSPSPITKQTLDHVQEEYDYDPPLSKEAKSPAYPDGPVCIYDPFVFLFLEPSKAEASSFDVILNVAREVVNPFAPVLNGGLKLETGQKTLEVALEPNGLNVKSGFPAVPENISEPQTAVSDNSFASALESQHDDASEAEKDTSIAVKPEPEYVHIPWDHNTNVVDDLLRLCELIDDRVRQNKRVLVHCQCGVSRSASLIVAYGLYKNPQLTVQEAYDAVKGRSKWIGPNMNLIYQLSEFKSKLPRPSFNAGPASWHSWRLGSSRSGPSRKLTPELAPTSGPVSSMKDGHNQPPLSAPFRKDLNLLVPKRADTLDPSGSPSITDKAKSGEITPGPSSAPPDMQWSTDIMAVNGFSAALKQPMNQLTSMASPLSMEVEASAEADLPSYNILDSLRSPTSSSFPQSIFGSQRTDEGSHVGPLPIMMDIDSTPQSPFSPLLPPPPPPSRAAPVPLSAAPTSSQNSTALPSPPMRPTPRSKPSLSLKPSNDSFGSLGFSRLAPSFSTGQTRVQQPRTLPLRQEAPRFPPSNPSPQIVFASDDPPPTPSLLSPRAVEFTSSPFHRTVAGDLAGSSVFEQGQPTSPPASSNKPKLSPMNLGFATPSSARAITKKKSSIFEQLQGVPSGNVGEVSEQTIEILPHPRDERAKEEDPRSPVNVEGEAGVVRSIFDVL